MLVAGKLLRITPEDSRMPGFPVPEASKWKNLKSYLDTGHVLQIPEGACFDDLETWTKVRVGRGNTRQVMEANGCLRASSAARPALAPVPTPEPERVAAEPDLPASDSTPGEEDHACDECDRTFGSKGGLSTHKRSAH